MAEQIITKICRTCKQTKPISEFYKDRSRKDGFRGCCKICAYQISKQYKKRYHQTENFKTAQKRYEQSEKGRIVRKRFQQSEKFKAQQKRYQQSEKGKAAQKRGQKRYKIQHPKHWKATNAVNSAIRIGRLPRLDSLQCHYCPAQAKHYHHHKDYEPEHWFDVVPVCIPCHNKIPKNHQ